ncbi:MAG: cytochrome c [Cyanobacteria bacterium P01_G01_bin.54]
MANSSLEPSASAPRLNVVWGIVVAIGLALLLGVGIYISHPVDPYIQAVITALGDSSQGHEIFEINCAGCHGIYATGNVGPSLENLSQRKSDAMIIHQVISGETPPMPKFQPTAQEMADLLNYLKRL